MRRGDGEYPGGMDVHKLFGVMEDVGVFVWAGGAIWNII